MVETRAPGTEQISQRMSFTKKRKMAFEGCPVRWGETGASPGKGSGKGWLGGRRGCKGFGCGGVGGRGTGPRDGANFATCVVFLSFLTRKKKKNGFF